jgi:septum formation protein
LTVLKPNPISKLKTLKILLGSKSPRRQQLLKEMGFDFSVVHQDIDERYPGDLAVDKIAPFLAHEKAKAVAGFLNDETEIILACDTTVICEGISYEKPRDRDDAIRILSALSGKTHYVMTAVRLLGLEWDAEFSEKTYVTFQPISFDEICYYVDTFKPYDKAGAYAIQEWIGLNKISKIEGSYYNVVGLPTHRLYEEILKFKHNFDLG